MTKDEALKLALEALELVNREFVCNGAHHAKKDRHGFYEDCPVTKRYQDAITSIKEALAQPEQEPVVGTKTWLEDGKVVTQHLTAKDIYKEPEQKFVAWMFTDAEGTEFFEQREDWEGKWTPLYTTSPQRTWVGLRWSDIPDQWCGNVAFIEGGRWAEKVLKEKNT